MEELFREVRSEESEMGSKHRQGEPEGEAMRRPVGERTRGAEEAGGEREVEGS